MRLLDILEEMHPQFDYAASSDFFADGLLDSFDLTRLIAELESAYGVKITGEELSSDNFRNLSAIQAMLARHGVEET